MSFPTECQRRPISCVCRWCHNKYDVPVEFREKFKHVHCDDPTTCKNNSVDTTEEARFDRGWCGKCDGKIADSVNMNLTADDRESYMKTMYNLRLQALTKWLKTE